MTLKTTKNLTADARIRTEHNAYSATDRTRRRRIRLWGKRSRNTVRRTTSMATVMRTALNR